MYYFTVASLPMLFYGTDAGPDRDTFLGICRDACSGKDFRLIESAGLEPDYSEKSGNALLDEWQSWETALRNELVRLRAKDGGKEPGTYLRSEKAFYVEVPDIAREAYGQDTPLQAEEVLNQARWSRLEELEVGHHFDLEKLLVYFLKLQLNERKSLFTKKTGEENFTRVYSSIYDTGNSREPVAGEY